MSQLSSVLGLFEGWILSLTHSVLALPILAVLCWGDGFFPPLPAGTFISALGATSASGHSGLTVRVTTIIVIAACAALLGDLTMVAIGRRIGVTGNSRFAVAARSVLSRLDSHWSVILSTSRFIPVVRTAIFLAAGARRIPLPRILILDGAAALTWATIYALSGLMGGSLTNSPLLSLVVGIVAGAMIGTLIGLVADRLQRRRTPVAPPDSGNN